MSASIEQRNQDATCYTGNLDSSVTEALLWEVRDCGTKYRTRYGSVWERENPILPGTRCNAACTPLGTAVPLWGQTSQIMSGLSPKWDCCSKRVTH